MLVELGKPFGHLEHGLVGGCRLAFDLVLKGQLDARYYWDRRL